MHCQVILSSDFVEILIEQLSVSELSGLTFLLDKQYEYSVLLSKEWNFKMYWGIEGDMINVALEAKVPDGYLAGKTLFFRNATLTKKTIIITHYLVGFSESGTMDNNEKGSDAWAVIVVIVFELLRIVKVSYSETEGDHCYGGCVMDIWML